MWGSTHAPGQVPLFGDAPKNIRCKYPQRLFERPSRASRGLHFLLADLITGKNTLPVKTPHPAGKKRLLANWQYIPGQPAKVQNLDIWEPLNLSDLKRKYSRLNRECVQDSLKWGVPFETESPPTAVSNGSIHQRLSPLRKLRSRSHQLPVRAEVFTSRAGGKFLFQKTETVSVFPFQTAKPARQCPPTAVSNGSWHCSRVLQCAPCA